MEEAEALYGDIPHEQEEETGGKGSGQVEGLGLNDQRRRWEETVG
jgi:hypothetical protein